jgi:hypothetical protein
MAKSEEFATKLGDRDFSPNTGWLDRLGWKSLQEWLLSRLKALNDQLNEQNQGHEILLILALNTINQTKLQCTH